MNLIGPYTVQTPTQKVELQVSTMIDPGTGWFKVKDITSLQQKIAWTHLMTHGYPDSHAHNT